MHETNSQFILLRIPPHLVRLLGKIHALSTEVLGSINLNAIASATLSIQKFKVNTMLNAFEKWCIIFALQYSIKCILEIQINNFFVRNQS